MADSFICVCLARCKRKMVVTTNTTGIPIAPTTGSCYRICYRRSELVALDVADIARPKPVF